MKRKNDYDDETYVVETKKKKLLVKIVGYDLVNVRERPSIHSSVLFRAKRNDEFLAESLGYAWIRVYDKKTEKEVGYVMRELLEEVVSDGQHS